MYLKISSSSSFKLISSINSSHSEKHLIFIINEFLGKKIKQIIDFCRFIKRFNLYLPRFNYS